MTSAVPDEESLSKWKMDYCSRSDNSQLEMYKVCTIYSFVACNVYLMYSYGSDWQCLLLWKQTWFVEEDIIHFN